MSLDMMRFLDLFDDDGTVAAETGIAAFDSSGSDVDASESGMAWASGAGVTNGTTGASIVLVIVGSSFSLFGTTIEESVTTSAAMGIVLTPQL
jgi:hypothetical protein